jgi:DNA polymerase III subunit epsilon
MLQKKEANMSQLEKQKFICLDCETTGLDPKADRIIEVAVMCFDANEIYSQMESLVDPQCEIPSTSIAIHNITAEMVQGKPVIRDVLPEILKVIGKHIIIGHGIQFDIDILATAAEREGIQTTIRQNLTLDTLRLARLYGESPVNSLEHLRKHFNIPMEGAHRAMSDVIVNKEVFKRLVKGYKTTDQLFEALSRPIHMNTMPLGKHKGRSLKDIPLQYLLWVANKDFDQDLLYSVRLEIKRRKKGNLFNQSGNPFKDL